MVTRRHTRSVVVVPGKVRRTGFLMVLVRMWFVVHNGTRTAN